MPIHRSQAEIFRAHGDALKAEIRKCLPATVTAVDVAKQTVSVQIGVNGVLVDELGTAVSVPAPSMSGVPLGVIRGGGFLVWVPVKVGDYVLLIFSDLSCDTWSASSSGTPVDPGFVGQHTHDSPFAIPMVAPDAKALTSPSSNQLVIGEDASDAQIRIGAGQINLGRSASDFVALATKVLTELQKIQATLLTGSNSGGPVVFGTPYTASPVAATKVQAQ